MDEIPERAAVGASACQAHVPLLRWNDCRKTAFNDHVRNKSVAQNGHLNAACKGRNATRQ
jgi:hypothetical protein